MKKVLAAIAAFGLILGGASAASAGHEEKDGPGPNGHNNHGLCTAYFNGQKNGHTEGDGPGPFGALEDESADNGSNENRADEQQVSDDVFEFCEQFGIGGNPEQNGRFDCRQGDEKNSPKRDSDNDTEMECVDNGDGVV